nr:3-deoxy-D-manno-octulosonic acid kinase [Glaciecola nitratireducens]
MIETFSVGPNEFILLPKRSTWAPCPETLNDDLNRLCQRFDPSWLLTENLITNTASGRGLVYFFSVSGENCVLRHYYRGGLVAKVSTDKFIFRDVTQTRPYQELSLLAKLHDAGLNVPKPLAAKLQHTRFSYTADIITGTIPRAQELHSNILQQALEPSVWHQIGATLRKMHDLQACHYDINVKNVLLQQPNSTLQQELLGEKTPSVETSDQPSVKSGDETQIKVYLLDFDGCKIRSGDAWKSANLARFKRSLEKQRAKFSPYYYDEDCWKSVVQGYQS